IRFARRSPHMDQHRTTSVSATGLVLAHVWATSGKPDLGHQRAVVLCGMWAMCKHIVWARSGSYQFCYVGKDWLLSNSLILNDKKTEIVIFDSHTPRAHLTGVLGPFADYLSDSASNLGVYQDGSSKLDKHVSSKQEIRFMVKL
uniref:Uncharacterized protein n=1 Tax=Pundamilia nyererei TaxID=303518 RepID=A0A3B4H917_9CICH